MQALSETELAMEGTYDPLLLGIVGCSVARTRFGAAFPFLPGLRVIALSDPDPRMMRAWSKILGGEIDQYPNMEALLAGDNRPDALLIDVPLAGRAEAVLTAIPACRALLCALPLAATLEETDRILHAAAVHDTLIMPAFPRRFDPVLAYAIEMANSGEVGLLQQVRCDWSFPLSRAYGVEIGADPDAGTWQSLLQYAACHAADVCRWCFGDVLTVSADIDDEAALKELPSRQRESAPLLANLVLGQEQGPSTCHFARARAVTPSERYIFSGTQGNIELILTSSTVPASSFPVLTIHRPGQRPQPMLPLDLNAPDMKAPDYRARMMLNDLTQSVRTGSSSCSGGDARAALEVVHAAYYSARDGRKIPLPLRRSPPPVTP